MNKEIRRYDLKNTVLDYTEDEDKKRVIRGLIPFDTKSVSMGGMYEVITKTAFNKTIADGAEVRALINHEESKVLGSTKSGTLKLRVVDNGLEAEVELPNTTYANDAFEVIKRGDVTTMSFGFIPVKFSDNGNTRSLNEVHLLEVSFMVMYPAYPATSSKTYLRSFVEEKKIEYEKLDEVFKKIREDKLEDGDKEMLKTFAESLMVYYKDKELVVEKPKEEAGQPLPKEDKDADKEKLLLELELEQILI